jgi:hypothetical protein
MATPKNLFCFAFLAFSVECRIYKSSKIGGDGGVYFDDIAQNSLQSADITFHFESIVLWGTSGLPILACHGYYNITNTVVMGQTAGDVDIFYRREEAEHDIALSPSDIVERMYGYYASSTGTANQYLTKFIGFDVRRANGTLEEYSLGIKEGTFVTILGPVVGFYGSFGRAIDAVGVYVDPSLWPDRPSRLIASPHGGKNVGALNELAFDHYIQLGEPFVIRIAQLVIFYGTNTVRGLCVVYEDHVRNRITVRSGNLSGKNVTVNFELGDYIRTLEINDNNGTQSSNLCLAGVRLTVFRGRSSELEVITVATVDNLLRTEGPVVAFHGLLQNTQPCIARLGGFQLLHSSELPRTCILPNLTGNAVASHTEERIGVNETVSVSCRNTSLVAVSGTSMRCREDGIWDREKLDCRVPCPVPVAPSNGYFVSIPMFLVDNVTVEAACDAGYTLTSGGMLTCVNGVWEGEDPQCNITRTVPCPVPVAPSNGYFVSIPMFLVDNVTVEAACDATYTLTSGGMLTCVNGVWEGEDPQCNITRTVPCPVPVAPSNGYFVSIPMFLVDNVTVEAACDATYTLTSGGMLTCVNGVWEGEDPQCNITRTGANDLSTSTIAGIAAGVGLALILIAATVCGLGVLSFALCVNHRKKQTESESNVAYATQSEYDYVTEPMLIAMKPSSSGGGKSPDLEAKCDIQYNTIQVGNSESNSITMIPNPSYGMLSPVV